MKQTSLELAFFKAWVRLQGPPLEAEFWFNKPCTRHRFDFAHLDTRTAIEVEGGTFIRGRHNRPVGYGGDCLKYNLAVSLRWYLFRLDTKMVREDAHYLQIIRFIQKAEVHTMVDRVPTGIDVLVYKPLTVKTQETGWARAVYPLALLSVAGGFYLIDPYGVGSPDLSGEGWYNQPVYEIHDSDNAIGFKAPIVGVFPITREYLSLLTAHKTVDLADFVHRSAAGDYRLGRWVAFVQEERARVAG